MNKKTKQKKIFEMNDDYHVEEEFLPVIPIPEPPAQDGPHEGDQAQAPPLELSVQVDQVVQGLSGVQIGGQVYLVDIRQLEPYPDQPFRQYPLDKLQELADDINRVGILSPILTRRNKNRLQILAGHNRWQAARLAGLAQVPVLILDVDDDQAILVLTSTNLRQREHLLPSEKAFAYKMQMDALKRQGQRVSEGEEPYNASSFITRQTGDSRMQIHRYIRLTELEAGLLELLDRGKVSMTPAVAVSHLRPEDQQEVLRCIREFGASLTIDRANRLKRSAEDAGMDMAGRGAVEYIMLEEKTKKTDPEYIRIRYDRIKEYLPERISEDGVEEWILKKIKGEREYNRI